MGAKSDRSNVDVYAAIGVRPFVNCCGTRTVYGGSLMLPEVKRAMEQAATRFVNIDELMEGVGRRLAELTGAGFGIVTSGAAAALCVATAACLTGGDPEKMLRLPNTAGLKRRVVMMRNGRFPYDHAIRMTGAEVVEVDSRAELEAALDGEVAMIALLGKRAADAPAPLEEIAAMARPRRIPILVDAASEHPARPVPYLARGASLVAYSGGKYLRGPQPTGLLLGEEALVRAAWLNAAPHHALGRALKIGKEEVIGCLAAVEHWFGARDHEADRRRWHDDLAEIAAEVTTLPGVTAEIRDSTDPTERVPSLEIRWDNRRIGIGGLELRARLFAGEPRVLLDDRPATERSVAINPFNLERSEPRLVGARIREVLAASPAGAGRAGPARTPAAAAGRWQVEIEFVHGRGRHELALEQSGAELTGTHRTAFHAGPCKGRVEGAEVEISSRHRFEGTSLAYRFTGTIGETGMAGEVEIGTEGQSGPGPVNRREFGTARWRASRRG
ncbi:MAG: hypothetical protein HY521_08915 [Proteobacteria bacterium]|nr:hypothetical protein [Pseudomonadota bacterium]